MVTEGDTWVSIFLSLTHGHLPGSRWPVWTITFILLQCTQNKQTGLFAADFQRPTQKNNNNNSKTPRKQHWEKGTTSLKFRWGNHEHTENWDVQRTDFVFFFNKKLQTNKQTKTTQDYFELLLMVTLLGKCSCLIECGSKRRGIIWCCNVCPAARFENNCLIWQELRLWGVRPRDGGEHTGEQVWGEKKDKSRGSEQSRGHGSLWGELETGKEHAWKPSSLPKVSTSEYKGGAAFKDELGFSTPERRAREFDDVSLLSTPLVYIYGVCLLEGWGHQNTCPEVPLQRADTCLFPLHFRKLRAYPWPVTHCGVNCFGWETAMAGLVGSVITLLATGRRLWFLVFMTLPLFNSN